MNRSPFLFLVTIASLTLAACAGAQMSQAALLSTETRPAATAPMPTTEPTKQPTAAPTEKPAAKEIKFNPNFLTSAQVRDRNDREFKDYTYVYYQDIVSGRLIKAAEEWYAKNPDFMKEAVPVPLKSISKPIYEGAEVAITENLVDFMNNNKAMYNKNKEKIPLKVVSFFVFDDPIILEAAGVKSSPMKWHWVVLWAYKSHKGNVNFAQSLIDILRYDQAIAHRPDNTENEVEVEPLPVFSYADRTQVFVKDERYRAWHITKQLWENHPELSPAPYVEEWLKTGEMPEEMSGKLFGCSFYTRVW